MDVAVLMSSTREERLAEVGTEPDCPFCHLPRVLRSSYIRCNECGINWLAEEMQLPDYLNRDPRVCRSEAARMVSSTPRTAEQPKADAKPYIPYDPKLGIPTRGEDGEWEQNGVKLGTYIHNSLKL